MSETYMTKTNYDNVYTKAVSTTSKRKTYIACHCIQPLTREWNMMIL